MSPSTKRYEPEQENLIPGRRLVGGSRKRNQQACAVLDQYPNDSISAMRACTTHIAIELATGQQVPDDVVVRHRCDQPACVNQICVGWREPADYPTARGRPACAHLPGHDLQAVWHPRRVDPGGARLLDGGEPVFGFDQATRHRRIDLCRVDARAAYDLRAMGAPPRGAQGVLPRTYRAGRARS